MLLKTFIMSPCAFHLAGVVHFIPLRVCVIGALSPIADNAFFRPLDLGSTYFLYLRGWFYCLEQLHKVKQLSPGALAPAFPHLELPAFLEASPCLPAETMH